MDEIVQKDLETFTIRPWRGKRLSEYYARMGRDDDHVLVDDNVKDALLSQGYQLEESPRSIYSVDKLFTALAAYAPGKNFHIQRSDEFAAGVALAYKCFARPKDVPSLHVLPLTPDTITLITRNPSGSPGLTNYGVSKAESQTRALERGLQTLLKVKQPEPCLAFKRTQFNLKTRLVWGYPYSMTVIEGLVAYCLIQMFKKGYTPMAFAMTAGHLGTKLRVAAYHKEWAYSLDMSQFDASLSAELIHIAFTILRTWFDSDEVEPISGRTVREIFDLIEHYFIHTTIVMPDGKVYIGKNHGVPSGSYFTQMIDSVCNVIIAGTLSKKFKLDVARKELFVLGDDLLMWSNRKVNLDAMAKYANSTLGVKLHGAEKSEIRHFDEPIHYLGRDWDKGIPDLPLQDILQRMVFPETFRNYSREPDVRLRQWHMMLLAYASTYRSAWEIAYNLILGTHIPDRLGCNYVDTTVYLREGDGGMSNPNFLSGLVRFQRKYLFDEKRQDIPLTATQFWV